MIPRWVYVIVSFWTFLNIERPIKVNRDKGGRVDICLFSSIGGNVLGYFGIDIFTSDWVWYGRSKLD